MLYSMYYRATYPDADKEWAVRASEARATGKLSEGERLVVSADNIYRYEIWDQENLDSYFQGLARLSKTKASHEKFVKDLTEKLGIEGISTGKQSKQLVRLSRKKRDDE